ncbi:MAG: AI-2E family transporter [Longimicrobiales bacterium]|nr:AI-2E family transporter [Longimicrobiales bacterium]
MDPTNEDRTWRLVHGVAVLLVLAVLLWELLDVLSPLVLYVAFLALMAPYSGSPFHRLLVLTTGGLLALWMLMDLGSLLAPFVLAFILAYVLDPLVDRVEALGVPRSPGIILLSLPVAGALAALLFFGVPALAQQLESLIQRAPELVERVASWVESLPAGIVALDLPLIDEEALAERIRSLSPAAVITYLEEQRAAIAQQAWQGVLGLGRGLGTAITVASYIVLTPVLTFYLLRDWDRIVDQLESYVPRPRRDRWTALVEEYDRLLSRYLRGQVLVATIVGVLTWIGLWIAGFPYSGLVGAVAGVFNVVPYLGLPVSLIPAIVISILSGSFLTSILKVAVVFAVVQFLDGNVIGPRVVGESVGLHPVWVVLAILVSGFFFGFVGLLLAIPAAILVKIGAEEGLERYKQSTVYLGEEAQTDR